MCCGNRRQQFQAPAPAPRRSSGVATPDQARGSRRQTVAYFQYTGATAMSAVGAVTGTRYRFGHRAAVVAVDPRDRPSLAAVPRLRQVANP